MSNRYKEIDEAPIVEDEKTAAGAKQKTTKKTSGNRVREEVIEEQDVAKEQPIHQKHGKISTGDNDEAKKDAEKSNTDSEELNEDKDENNEASEAPHNKVNAKKIMKSVIGGDILNGKWIKKQIPLMLLILFFLIIIVSNRYKVENLTKERIATKDRIDQMREQRIQARSQYQHSIQISTIAEQLDTIGVGIVAEPPYLIEIEK